MEQNISLILLIAACIIFLLLFIYSFRTRVSLKQPKSADISPQGETMQMHQAQDDFIVDEIIVKEAETIDAEEPLLAESSTSVPTTDLLVLHVFPKSEAKFMGYDLLQALLAANLRFGKMSIFHRYENSIGEGNVLFSLLQAKEPGTFDMENIGSLQNEGLTLFMQLTGEEHNLEALNTFIQTAQQLADSLSGELKNQQHAAFSTSTEKLFRRSVEKHMETFANGQAND